jgi:hypothetical protein
MINMPARLEKVGDLLKPMLKMPQKLPARVFTTGDAKATEVKATATTTPAGGGAAAPAKQKTTKQVTPKKVTARKVTAKRT